MKTKEELAKMNERQLYYEWKRTTDYLDLVTAYYTIKKTEIIGYKELI